MQSGGVSDVAGLLLIGRQSHVLPAQWQGDVLPEAHTRVRAFGYRKLAVNLAQTGLRNGYVWVVCGPLGFVRLQDFHLHNYDAASRDRAIAKFALIWGVRKIKHFQVPSFQCCFQVYFRQRFQRSLPRQPIPNILGWSNQPP